MERAKHRGVDDDVNRMEKAVRAKRMSLPTPVSDDVRHLPIYATYLRETIYNN